MRAQWTIGLVMVAALGSCAIPAIDSGAAGDCVCNCNNACGGEQTFEYLVNGVLSHQTPTMGDVDVSNYREVVVYIEQATDGCNNASTNSSTFVDVKFKVDTGSPAGETGQGFNFNGGSGGRFRVDGVAMQLVPRCDGEYSFNYTIAGVACAGAN